MREAANKLENELETISINEPNIPIISNVGAEVLQGVAGIKQEMVEQVYSPVLWEQDVRKMLELGVTTFIECGPGKVLSGLVKKVDRSVNTYCVYDIETLNEVIQAIRGE
jgi:[acyl-carrier-protein] S-malonyltransferase